MTSLQVRYFLHLCGTKRVSETARQLFVAQPAVSKQIAALERELGTALFVRTNRGVELTSAGECYRDFFSESDRKFHCLQAELRRAADLEQRSLAVGILENLGLDEVSDVIAQLRSQHPGLRLAVARLDHPTLLEPLFNGWGDAVGTFDHALDHRTGVRYTELLLEQSCFLISREHPLAARPDLAVQDLSGQIFCETRSREGDGTDGYLRRLLALLKVTPGAFVPMDNLASGLEAVEHDHAIGLVDERAQLLHPERYRFLPSGTYQSIVCASLAENENPCIIQLGDALRAALNGAKQSI